MSQVRTRKRPAPGTSPLPSAQQRSSHSPAPTSNWQPQSQSNYTYPDLPHYDAPPQNAYSQVSATDTQPTANQLARRAVDQPVVPIQNYAAAGSEPWQYGENGQQISNGNAWPMQHDDLDQRAEVAKTEAQSNRKQIPPFVQKLSSFLDESRNTDLIRWSESGDSFIVVDEDEFAKTLIPELFKHNNYASFVRQLNMYGFHKKVGLSDNSMRASERKNKQPSEYSNPFFKRGRPNLLWLIQKPKNPSAKTNSKSGSKAKREEYDEEVDEIFGRDPTPLPGDVGQLDDGTGLRGHRQNLLTIGGNISPMPPQNQLSSVQQELADIRSNQVRISQMLNEVRREHKQLYGQAKAFHELHEKHDTSINAILTFLATVYSKNLDGQQGGLGDVFPGSIPPSDQQRGNVVDMGDVRDHSVAVETPKPYKRAPLLLEDGKRSPMKPQTFRRPDYSPMKSMKPAGKQGFEKANIENQYLQSPIVQELSDNSNRSSASPQLKPEDSTNDNSQQIPKADIMSMLNNAAQNNNAFSPNTPMDFSEALSHLQHSGGSTPLTPGQRQNMLQLMGNEDPNINNALPQPSPPPENFGDQAYFDQTNNNLEHLDQFMRRQSNAIDNLSTTLTPLSPSGSIPGISSDPPAYPSGGPDLLDLDNIFNSNDYFNDIGGGGNLDFNSSPLPDFDFGAIADVGGDVDGAFDFTSAGAADEEARVKEMGSSEGTSPANTTLGAGLDEEGLGSPAKRRRLG